MACIINSSLKILSPGQLYSPKNREEWVSVRRFESLIYWGELHIYVAYSKASYKAVVSKFIVSQARPQQIQQKQFKVTNFACANWQMRFLSCITCSLVPSPSPQLLSLAVRITVLTVIRIASDDSCGEDWVLVLQATTAAVKDWVFVLQATTAAVKAGYSYCKRRQVKDWVRG